MLAGHQIDLRPYRRSDIQCFLRWFNDPEITQFLTVHFPLTEMVEEKYFDNLGGSRSDKDAPFIVEVREGDHAKAIGSVGLHNINAKDQCASFGIVIGEKEYWGRGHGVEAAKLLIRYGFEQLNLHRINSSVLDFNERSLRLHQKIGFRNEGRQRQAVF